MFVVVLSLLVCWCAAEGLDNPADPWRTWLLIEDQVPSGDLLLRRITPKSVFIAPPIHKCPEGYRTDAMGRCVKIVKVDQAAQWEFFLNKLNSMFAFPASEPSSSFSSNVNSVPSSNEEDRGPFQVSIPFAKQNSSSKDTTVTPPPTISPVSSTTNTMTPPTSVGVSISTQPPTSQTVPSSTHSSQSVDPQDYTERGTDPSTTASGFSNAHYPVTTETASISSINYPSSEETVEPAPETTTISSTVSSISSSNSYSTMSVSSSTSNTYNRAPINADSSNYGSTSISNSGGNIQSSSPYSSGSSHSYSSVPMHSGSSHTYGSIPISAGNSYYNTGPFSSSSNHYNSAPFVSSSSNYNSAPVINGGSSYITAPVSNSGGGYNTAPIISSSSSSYNSAPVSSSGHRYHSAPISSSSGGYNTASMYYATAGDNKHNFTNVDVDTSAVASAPSSLGNTESNLELVKKPFLIVVPNSSDYVDSTVATTTPELPTTETETETYTTSLEDLVTSTSSINSTPVFFDEDKQNLSRIDEISSSVGITEANVEVVKKPFLIVVPNSADYYVETTTQDVPTTETFPPSDPTTVTTPTESTDWTTTVMTDSLPGSFYRYT